MTDLSLVHPRVAHMPTAAVMLAILLHAALATAFWWFSPFNPPPTDEEPIMVMFDSTPSNVGLQTPERVGPPPESLAASPPPPGEPQRPVDQQQALAPPRADVPSGPAPTLPLFEFSVPPPPEPPPPPTSRDFPKPSQLPPRPVQRTLPLPTRPGPPTQQRPPAEAPASMPAPYAGPQPADSLAGPGRQRWLVGIGLDQFSSTQRRGTTEYHDIQQ